MPVLTSLRALVRDALQPESAPAELLLDPDDPLCDELAAGLVGMGPHAAGDPSPGTPALLARARLLGRRQFEDLINPLSRGIAASSAGSLRVGELAEAAERADGRVAAADADLERHDGREPERPRVIARVCANPVFRVGVAALCVVIELVLTAPALAVLGHGKRLATLPIEDVLAGLLGLVTFVAAELAAECFLTWRLGRPLRGGPARSRLRDALRRAVATLRHHPAASARTARGAQSGTTSRDARAALGAGVLLTVAMLVVLGWFVTTREENVRAANAIREAGAPAASTSVIPGLPSGASTPASGASGPIGGLGGIATSASGPLSFGAAPASVAPRATAGDEGSLGPLGALSVVAFLVALCSAVLAGTTGEHRDWQRERKRLRARREDAVAAAAGARAAQADAATRTPAGSVAYDTAARQAVNVVDAYLQLVRAWEARVQRLYLSLCRSGGVTPVALTFPPLPELPEETERLLTPVLPDGQQAGGHGHGTVAVTPADAPAPAPGPGPLPSESEPVAPGASGEPEAGPDDDAPPAPDAAPRADADGVLDDLQAVIAGMRPQAPAARTRTGRFVRGLRRLRPSSDEQQPVG